MNKAGTPPYTKKIIKPGDGKTKPKKGQTAIVHYTGKLTNGKQFDSSEGGDPFQFKVGAGEVIRAWDFGVAEMTLGEEAEITAQPEFAYGKQGYPPVIPPNSVLIFNIKLLNLK